MPSQDWRLINAAVVAGAPVGKEGHPVMAPGII
jgi:hypothetical protein